jgi:hypothetical protein
MSEKSGGTSQGFSGLAHSREFLEILMSLRRSASSAEATPEKSRSRRPLVLALTAVVALLLVLAREQSWELWWGQASVPEVFHGMWGTSARPYTDRGFVISRDSLQLRFGAGRGIWYPIVRVNGSLTEGSTAFTLYYRDGEATLRLPLHLRPDTTIYFASLPQVVWTKQSR